MDDVCKTPRWNLIKATLKNLDYDTFLHQASMDENAIILDVRTPKEYEDDHLPQAQNLNYLSYDLADEIEQLDKNKSYYVYCKTGRRSLRVCTLLKNAGFLKVFNMDKDS
jgi:rhodanese-related sulfurtransferase